MKPLGMILLTLLIGFPAGLPAQDDRQLLQLPTLWKVGEAHRLRIERDGGRLENDKVVMSNQKSTIDVDVVVKARNETGPVIRWTYGKSKLSGEGAEDPLSLILNRISDDIVIDIQTDSFGSAKSVLNTEWLAEQYKKRFEQTVKEVNAVLVAQGKPKDGMTDYLRRMFSILTNEDSVGETSLAEAEILYRLCGSSFTRDQSVEFKSTMKNALGSEPFPCDVRYSLVDTDFEKKLATIEWSRNADPEKTSAIIHAIAIEMAKKRGETDLEKIKANRIAIVDKATYIMSAGDGWPRSVSYERTTRKNDQGTISRVEFKRLPAH